jgi:RNA polymerase sigma-70 factor (ECF subfamily)
MNAFAAEGRTRAYEALFTRTYADVLRFVARRAHPSHAEDVVAEVYLVAWRRFDDLPEGEGARAWLFGVARNVLLTDHRAASRRAALDVRLADARQHPAGDDAGLVSARVDLSRAWGRLTADQRECLALTALDGLTSAEAATVLGTSAVAYRIRLSRARSALRAHLDTPAPRDARPAAASQTEGSPR